MYAFTSSNVGGSAGSAGAMMACTRRPHSGILQAHDHDVGDLGVVDQRGLDLGGEHVGAAGDDEVDAPIDQVEVTVDVEVAHVADGAEAVVGHGDLGRFSEVGRADVVGRPYVDVSDLTGGDVVAVVVEDADLGAVEAATDAAFVFHPFVARSAR